MAFRCKTAGVTEWGPFQERFGDLFMLHRGDKRLALFIHSEPGDAVDTVLIPDFKSDVVEALWPGGWQDAEDVETKGWTLLVGNASANEDFGLKTPKIAGDRD